jgi:hypothetical protein
MINCKPELSKEEFDRWIESRGFTIVQKQFRYSEDSYFQEGDICDLPGFNGSPIQKLTQLGNSMLFTVGSASACWRFQRSSRGIG